MVFPGTGTPEWKLDFVPTSEGFYSFEENRYIYQYRDHLGNARISYARNSEGAIEITDVNNYYPFGLNHIEGISRGHWAVILIISTTERSCKSPECMTIEQECICRSWEAAPL